MPLSDKEESESMVLLTLLKKNDLQKIVNTLKSVSAVSLRNKKDIIQHIVKSCDNAKDLLKRQKMTKYVLIKYLVMYINAHAQDEEIAAVDPKSIPKMRKRDLIETVLNFWGSPKEAMEE